MLHHFGGKNNMYLEAIREAGETVCILAFAMILLMLGIWKLQRHKRQCQDKALDDLLAQWPLPEGQETQPLHVLDLSPVQELGKPEFASLLRQLNESFTDKELDGLYRVCQDMEKGR